MRDITCCPVCECDTRSIVCEFNALILLDEFRNSEMARYDHALCDRCGLVYATRRPTDEEFKVLFENFDENLGRRKKSREQPALMSETERDRVLRALRAPVAGEEALPQKGERDYAIRVERARSIPLYQFVASQASLKGARVLEIRPKRGWVLDALRRDCDADVYALPAFEAHDAMLKDLYGLPSAMLDFVHFTIPFEGQFDLVISNHMLLHSLDPGRFLATLAERVKPGGAVYFYQELSDAVMFERRKNLIGEMKCFHFQNFDVDVYCRLISRYGFTGRPVRQSKSVFAVWAQRDDSAALTPIDHENLQRRREMYLRWRDESLLTLPMPVQAALGEVVKESRARALKEAWAVERDGELVITGSTLLCHREGYERLNAVRQMAAGQPRQDS